MMGIVFCNGLAQGPHLSCFHIFPASTPFLLIVFGLFALIRVHQQGIALPRSIASIMGGLAITFGLVL